MREEELEHLVAGPEKLILIRHAHALNNSAHKKVKRKPEFSSFSCSLTPLGRKQADFLRQWHDEHGPFDVYLTSPHARSEETHRIVCPDVHVRENSLLAEIRSGITKLIPPGQLKRFAPREKERALREGLYYHRPLNGEGWIDGENRIRMLQLALRLDYTGKTVCCFTHGKNIRMIIKVYLDLSYREILRLYDLKKIKTDNASVTILERIWDVPSKRFIYRLDPEEFNIVPWKGKL